MKKFNLALRTAALALAVLATLTISVSTSWSDPCGMVPPIYTGPGTPISRIGLQQTYVYFDEGVESFVIRPGFEGKVDNFGMLIPFPNPPALRKVPDNVFDQIAAAVDPPEVVIDLMPVLMEAAAADAGGFGGGGLGFRDQVRVVKQEAVGMYEVAVLEAGSAAALKRWMDQNKYQYPDGMDDVCEDYVQQGWCFVAVKTRVADKSGADPQPGQRQTNPQLPQGSVFDGTVQGLGFRFKTDKLVVPMRLSAFNEGELRNVVYLLTRGGKKIRAIPEEYVVRQLDGQQLVDNLTKPLAVRLINGRGGKLEIPQWRRTNLAQERDPEPHNGVAKQIFLSDLAATQDEDLSLDHEETEKELLRISERFGLRGQEIDSQIEAFSKQQSSQLLGAELAKLKQFTLTVVDGDFPRQVIAQQNLTFADFQIAAQKNTPLKYDTRLHGPGKPKTGKLIGHLFNGPAGQHVDRFPAGELILTADQLNQSNAGDLAQSNPSSWNWTWLAALLATVTAVVVLRFKSDN